MTPENRSDFPDGVDAMLSAPDHHEVILENDQVRVLDTRLGRGETTPYAYAPMAQCSLRGLLERLRPLRSRRKHPA